MEQPVKDPSKFKTGITYIQCSQCDWWYPEGHGCPDHNPWRKCQNKTSPLIIYYREANHGMETIKTRGEKIIAGYGHDYVIMVAEGEYYSVKKEIFDETYDILDDVLEILAGQPIKISCPCGADSWNVDSSDEALEDCDLMEERHCNTCGRTFNAKYRLISFDIVEEPN